MDDLFATYKNEHVSMASWEIEPKSSCKTQPLILNTWTISLK
jgi:hypothetical protein